MMQPLWVWMRYKLVIANLTSDFYRLFKVSDSSTAVIISLFSIILPVVSQGFFKHFFLFSEFVHRGEKTHWTLSPWRTSPWSSSGTSSFSEELVCFSPGCSFIHFTQICAQTAPVCHVFVVRSIKRYRWFWLFTHFGVIKKPEANKLHRCVMSLFFAA